MKKSIIVSIVITVFWLLTCNMSVAAIKSLKISSNNRFLVTADGNPVFLNGDTAWHIAWKLNRPDVAYYITTRQSQKFNAFGMVAFPDETPIANQYGDQPFQIVAGKYDPLQPIITPGNNPNNSTEYDYWDNVEYIIDQAYEKGLYVILLPAWGNTVVGSYGGALNSEILLDTTNGYLYANWLAGRFRYKTNIVWMLGGDRSAVNGSHDSRPVFRAIAEGLADGISGVTNHDGNADYSKLLMSYHPRKWAPNSSEWFQNDSWLSFNSIQDQPSDEINSVNHDYGLTPVKPTWLFEGRYEGFNGFSDWQTRFQAYQTVFAGAFGNTYGNMSIWGLDSDWKDHLNDPGALDLQYLSTLMTSWNNDEYLNRIPDQSILNGDTGGMSSESTSSYILATRTSDGKKTLVYSANGRDISVKMYLLAGPAMNAQWFNPRSGAWSSAGSAIPSGTGAPIHTFDPAGSASDGNDWVLVLDSGGGNVPPPEPVPPYTDDINNLGLLHCDSVITNTWADGSPDCFITPDDNSSGRTACSPIMNSSNDYWHIARDDSTMPGFETNSPYTGDYLHFDGGDAIIITNGWRDADNMYLDLAFRLDGLPSMSDNYMGVLMIDPIKVYVQNVGSSQGKILTIVYKTAIDGQFLSSTKILNLGEWYHLTLSVSNNNEILTVGSESGGFQTDTKSLTGMKSAEMDYVVIGNSFWVPSRTFQGDMDEIRWGNVVPEPYCLSFIIYCLLFTNHLRKYL